MCSLGMVGVLDSDRSNHQSRKGRKELIGEPGLRKGINNYQVIKNTNNKAFNRQGRVYVRT